VETSTQTPIHAFATRVFRELAVVGFVVLMAMAIWILIDVCSSIFKWGLPGMVDWVEILNVIAIALPLPYVTLQRKHIRMTLIHEHLSPKGGQVLDMVAMIVTFLFTAIMAWRLSVEALYSLKIWERSEVGMIVYWFPAKIGLALGLILTALALIIQIIGTINKNMGEKEVKR
jgi:TRAP-type mannitol/chloroaromatic compound transport system permease small subunit